MLKNMFKIFICVLIGCVSLFFIIRAQGETGIEDKTIIVGQSCALTGPAAALGVELKMGAEAYFDKVNKDGGVNGKKIKLVSLDDGYEPDRCIDNTRKLINDEKAFVLFGYVGTPTCKAAIQIIDEAGIPLVGPFTGAGFLRDPSRKVFNIRGTYDQETEMLVERFNKDLNITKIACFYQNDAYGKAGLSGVMKGLQKYGLELVGSATYERNTVAVKSAAATLKQLSPEAIIMIGAYEPCAEFIKLSKKIGMNCEFANISFVGTAKLIEAMGESGENTYISQVMPSPMDSSIAFVKECTDLLGRQPTYGELEGFLDAKVLVKGLEDSGSEITRDSFLKAMESFSDYDAGGVVLSYSSDNHQGMKNIFITKVKDGKAISINKLG
ncbi:ABC transporter substrate-binding protein [bacterium]|nr:ABC transporter substrate-binding protein [bacterium]